MFSLMSLSFWCEIQMLGTEFGVNNTKAWIHLVCINNLVLAM